MATNSKKLVGQTAAIRPPLSREKFDELCDALSAAYAATRNEPDASIVLLKFQVRLVRLRLSAVCLRNRYFPQPTAIERLEKAWREAWGASKAQPLDATESRARPPAIH
jgi:hypothetical protein